MMVWGGLITSLGCLGRGHVGSSPHCRDVLCPVLAMSPQHTHTGTWDLLRWPCVCCNHSASVLLASRALSKASSARLQVVVPNGKQRVCSINQMCVCPGTSNHRVAKGVLALSQHRLPLLVATAAGLYSPHSCPASDSFSFWSGFIGSPVLSPRQRGGVLRHFSAAACT